MGPYKLIVSLPFPPIPVPNLLPLISKIASHPLRVWVGWTYCLNPWKSKNHKRDSSQSKSRINWIWLWCLDWVSRWRWCVWVWSSWCRWEGSSQWRMKMTLAGLTMCSRIPGWSGIKFDYNIHAINFIADLGLLLAGVRAMRLHVLRTLQHLLQWMHRHIPQLHRVKMLLVFQDQWWRECLSIDLSRGEGGRRVHWLMLWWY